MILGLSRTKPLRRLMARIGSSTYRLNTILVGLKCVAESKGDSGAMAVTWTKPLTPAHAKRAADQAAAFACSGAVVLAADVFDSYLRELAQEDWLGFAEATTAIATKAKTRSGGIAYSVAERAAAVAEDLGAQDPVRLALIELLAKWRNGLAHTSNERKPDIDGASATVLMSAAQTIHDRHAHLDIRLALENFRSRRAPVAKEATSMIANVVKWSQIIDAAAIRRVASTEHEVISIANSGLGRYLRAASEQKPARLISDAWQGDQKRRSATILKWMQEIGFTESKDRISAPLPSDYVAQLALLDRALVARKLGLNP
jgi:hypothetical protein